MPRYAIDDSSGWKMKSRRELSSRSDPNEYRHKTDAVREIDAMWEENPERWAARLEEKGFLVPDFVDKKAAGGFIDKPLYERTL